ncbi:MAG: acetate--CoA ligase family protein [Candidatus Cloacimonetes bacterium]|nr:acetate--CoA ligase family protein [Candidatus Cloacimonadota bacterium]
MTKDFKVSKFYAYSGPSYYLNRQAVVFNLSIDPQGKKLEYYKEEVLEKFPVLKDDFPGSVVDLFAEVLIQVLKMDINLFINNHSIGNDGDEFVIAVEYLDDLVTEDAVYFVSEWFQAMNDRAKFDFDGKFLQLQDDFDKTLFGGPTLYSLIEAGLKRNIPVFFLKEENQFQWGYGKKQIRGRSTTLHVDGIKDTEFTMFKDMCGEFLEMCGFPTPTGTNTFSEDEAVEVANELGYPVVVKPVAGHKGQGVTTGIESEKEVRKAYQNIISMSADNEVQFEGALVQQQVYGTDHRLLAVGGKFAAALERVPAYVDGNGKDDIKELIRSENDKLVRLDNARSPLCKIKIDDDLKDFLELQKLSLSSVPKDGARIELRRVANISQGGVSINVTDKIHSKNIKLVEDIAKYFTITCLGIDVLAKDISKPWTDGDFGIIEVNAGPGVFMHLAPALGGSIDVPGQIIRHHFPKDGYDRIPIIAGNKLTTNSCNLLYGKLKEIKPDVEFGSLTEEGVSFNGEHFFKNKNHDQNVKMIMRNPKLDFAVMNHNKDDIFDFGTLHEGSDIVILENPHYGEKCLKRDLFEGGVFIEVNDKEITVSQNEKEIGKYMFEDNKDEILLKVVEPFLAALLKKYE